MKKVILWVVGIAVGIIALVVLIGMYKFNVLQDDIYFTQEDGSTVRAIDLEEYAFETDNFKVGVFAYTNKEKTTATLKLESGFYQLEQAVAASGAKYQTADGQVVFWEKGGEATVKVGDEVHTTTKFILLAEADEGLTARIEMLRNPDQQNEIYFDDIFIGKTVYLRPSLPSIMSKV